MHVKIRVSNSCKFEVSKGIRINGHIYNISINEEEPIQRGGSCFCPKQLYASSDSISSMDSFIGETIFSDKVFEDGDVNTVAPPRWGEEAKEGRELSLETNTKQIRELSQVVKGKQNKEHLSCVNEVRREQGTSAARAAFSEQEKVNTICSFLHKSLSDLALCVQNFNPSTTQPVLDVGQSSKAQSHYSGLLDLTKQGALGGMEEVCARSEQGNSKAPTSPGGGGSELLAEASVNFDGNITTKHQRGLAHPHGPTRSGEVERGPTLLPGRDLSGGSGEPSSMGSSSPEKRGRISVKATPSGVEGSKTPENVRRLRDLWEQGTKPSCLRWRNKGGLRPLHYGINSSSRLSHCSFAESVSDIEHCNNRLRLEDYVAESARIWDARKELGVRCSGEEVDVVVELECMEVREGGN